VFWFRLRGRLFRKISRDFVGFGFHASPSNRSFIVGQRHNHFPCAKCYDHITFLDAVMPTDLNITSRSRDCHRRNVMRFATRIKARRDLATFEQVLMRLPRRDYRPARSDKDCVSVGVAALLGSDPTQSTAHSLVPLTVPISLQPGGSCG
jgi:hypothetical protein